MNGLLYHRSTYRTGRQLGLSLGVSFGKTSQILARRTGHRSFNRLIRWGSQQSFAAALELNTPQALAAASDKLRAFRILEEAEIRTPMFSTTARSLDPEAVILGRNRHGARGTDIRVHEPENRGWCESEFYTEYIPNRYEARIHVFQGRVIRVQKKYLDFPEQRTDEHIKNHANGYRFRSPQRNLNASRTLAATQAVEALGLDFGAVDLLVGEDGLEYVLEVNTAPACSPLTARAYVECFGEWLGVEPDYTKLEALRCAAT